MGKTSKKLKSNMKTGKAYKAMKRQRIAEIGKCEYCGRSYQHVKLQIHHNQKVANCPDLFTAGTNMIVLCDDCHKKIHHHKDKNHESKISPERTEILPTD